MLSQPMGFHYGSKFRANGDGEYTVKLSVSAMSTRRREHSRDGSRSQRPSRFPSSTASSRKRRSYSSEEDKAATHGAVDPMEMKMMPGSLAPSECDRPCTAIGSGMSNDAKFVSRMSTPAIHGCKNSYRVWIDFVLRRSGCITSETNHNVDIIFTRDSYKSSSN